MRTFMLSLRQTPMLLRAFFRQGNQVFWNYGFFLLMLVFACSLFGAADPLSLQPLLGTSILALALLSGGLYGVTYGVWNFFRGGVTERYLRSPWRASAILAYLGSRFLIVFTALLLQILVLVLAYGVSPGGFAGWLALLLTLVLADLCCILLGFVTVTLSRAHFRSYFLSNLAFVCLVVLGGVTLPLSQMPQGVATFGRALPSAHIVEALRAILAGPAPWSGAWPYMVYLALWSAGLAVVAWATFDWMVLDRAR